MIHKDGKVLYRDAQTAKTWFERMRLVVLSEGFAGMERELSALLGELKGKPKKAHRESEVSLFGYIADYRHNIPEHAGL